MKSPPCISSPCIYRAIPKNILVFPFATFIKTLACHTNTKSLNMFTNISWCVRFQCVCTKKCKNVKLWHNRNKRFDHPIYLDIESSANSLESGYNNTKLFYLLDKKNPEIKTSCWFQNNNTKRRMHCWNHCLRRTIIFIAKASIKWKSETLLSACSAIGGNKRTSYYHQCLGNHHEIERKCVICQSASEAHRIHFHNSFSIHKRCHTHRQCNKYPYLFDELVRFREYTHAKNI